MELVLAAAKFVFSVKFGAGVAVGVVCHKHIAHLWNKVVEHVKA
jgi:hypothetical protein